MSSNHPVIRNQMDVLRANRSRRERAGRAVLLAICALLATGCEQEMSNQPRYEPLEQSDFFADNMSSRQPIAGTVSRGYHRQEAPPYSEHYLTGLVNGQPADALPPELLEDQSLAEILVRGRERYNVYCSHCHDLVGTGQGFVPQRGFPSPPSYHIERLREVPLGHFFRVITNGKGRMAPHASQVPVPDRWAIAAYIRALQLSQHAEQTLLEGNDLQQLEGPTP